jgi:sialic acid synthase SpsE
MSRKLSQLIDTASDKPIETLYSIAELGINHNGNFQIACQMIEHASMAGFSAVKLQKRTIQKVYSPSELSKPRKSFAGTTNRDLKQALEFSIQTHVTLAKYAHSLGLDYGLSVWDLQSAEEVYNNPNFDFIKIPSPRIGHTGLLEKINELHREAEKTKPISEIKPIFISSGMSSYAELKNAIRILTKTSRASTIIALYCTSEYPTQPKHENLSLLPFMLDMPGIAHIGYSSHSTSASVIISTASIKKVSVLEFHCTINQNMPGSDQSISWEFPEAEKILDQAQEVRDAFYAINGNSSLINEVKECEFAARKKLWRESDADEEITFSEFLIPYYIDLVKKDFDAKIANSWFPKIQT